MPELIYHEILDSTLPRSLVRSGSSYTRYFYLFLPQKNTIGKKKGHKKNNGPKKKKKKKKKHERGLNVINYTLLLQKGTDPIATCSKNRHKHSTLH